MTATPRWVEGELRLAGGLNQRLFNLLAAIDSTGSINRAARIVGLTYKGAWEMIERANNLSPKLLVTTATGGAHGGGTRLTSAGRELLNLYQGLQQEHCRFLEQLNQRLAVDRDSAFLLRRLIMKASARNQFFGQVETVKPGTVITEVKIAIKGDQRIVATVTNESAKDLGIAPGVEVVALIKAPLVMVVTDTGGYRLSARNQLTGKIGQVIKGTVNSEVVIELAGGNTVAATITNDSVEALGLAAGVTATAVFKAGAVILGVAG